MITEKSEATLRFVGNGKLLDLSSCCLSLLRAGVGRLMVARDFALIELRGLLPLELCHTCSSCFLVSLFDCVLAVTLSVPHPARLTNVRGATFMVERPLS